MDKIISDVAIYLRKSRGDGEEDLEKHKRDLVELAKYNKWKYVIYSEIGSADTIADRPKMVELLRDISSELYDAILVVDYDRLGRGNLADQATIKDTFSSSDTFIITPQKVYDLRNDSDDMLSDFLGLMARFEYKQIKKRLARGKRQGAKGGNWTNGIPPFPYVYNAESKSLVVDEQKRPLYNHIKERVLRGEALQAIAVDLNRQGNRTNKGSVWSPNAILRIVTNEVHLGRIIFGKSRGSGHVKKKDKTPLVKIDRSEWIIYENAHEAVMIEDEFNTIKATLERNKLVHKAARKSVHHLSGLVRCGRCGYSMAFNRKEYGGREHILVKTCQHLNLADGTRCHNSGIKADILIEHLRHYLASESFRLTQESESIQSSERERLSLLLSDKEAELVKLRKSLDRLKDLYEFGDIERDEFIGRREKRQAEIKDCEKNIEDIRSQIGYYETRTNEERLKQLRTLSMLWEVGTPKEINLALKKVISGIFYIKEGDSVEIDVKLV